MENPFDIIEERFSKIEEKLDLIIKSLENFDINHSPTWVTTKQLANQLGVSSSTITKLRGDKLPYYKIGGRIMFKRQEVDEVIEKTRHKTKGDYLDEYLKSSEAKERLK